MASSCCRPGIVVCDARLLVPAWTVCRHDEERGMSGKSSSAASGEPRTRRRSYSYGRSIQNGVPTLSPLVCLAENARRARSGSLGLSVGVRKWATALTQVAILLDFPPKPVLETRKAPPRRRGLRCLVQALLRYYCTAFTMSKIGRYIATTMPPTTTPRNTIITGSISASRPDTAASTSSS